MRKLFTVIALVGVALISFASVAPSAFAWHITEAKAHCDNGNHDGQGNFLHVQVKLSDKGPGTYSDSSGNGGTFGNVKNIEYDTPTFSIPLTVSVSWYTGEHSTVVISEAKGCDEDTTTTTEVPTSTTTIPTTTSTEVTTTTVEPTTSTSTSSTTLPPTTTTVPESTTSTTLAPTTTTQPEGCQEECPTTTTVPETTTSTSSTVVTTTSSIPPTTSGPTTTNTSPSTPASSPPTSSPGKPGGPLAFTGLASGIELLLGFAVLALGVLGLLLADPRGRKRA